MMKQLLVCVLILSYFCGAASANAQPWPDKVELIYFYSPACTLCDDADKLLTDIEESSGISVRRYNLNDKESLTLMKNLLETRGLEPELAGAAPAVFSANGYIIGPIDAGKTLDWLLSLVSREWNDLVTIVGKEPLDIDADVDWDIIENPGLIAEMKTNVFPAMYIVENGTVSYRAMPTMPVFAKGIIDGLRGGYENSTTYAQTGVKLPQINLEEKDGSSWSNNIRRNTVFIMVDTSCFVCAPAVEWAATLNNLDADVFLVITASSKHRYNNMLYLQQEHPDLVPGEFEPPGEAEEIALADYISTFGRPGNVLIDRRESVYTQWSVVSWPSVIITDKDGLVVEKMVLSLGSGRIDGTRFAYPTETVEGVLARLPR